ARFMPAPAGSSDAGLGQGPVGHLSRRPAPSGRAGIFLFAPTATLLARSLTVSNVCRAGPGKAAPREKVECRERPPFRSDDWSTSRIARPRATASSRPAYSFG